jgi:hypothetical protein
MVDKGTEFGRHIAAMRKVEIETREIRQIIIQQ